MRLLSCRGADRRVVAEAADALRDGKIIIYPTDTLYALGCNALNARAVEKLCRLKNLNPEKNMLSIVCRDISQAAEYTRIDNKAFRMLKEYLPGAFTFILPAATKLPKVFRSRKSVGVRIPDNDFARALAEELGNPVMSSSVEIDEGICAQGDTLDAYAIADRYDGSQDIAFAVDGGEMRPVPSTIVDIMESDAPTVIRQGAGIFEE